MTIWSGCSRSARVDCQVWISSARALDEGGEAGEAVDGEERRVVGVERVGRGQDLRPWPFQGCFWKKQASPVPAGAAEERERAAATCGAMRGQTAA